MQSIPIDWIFWPSLIVLAAGVLALVPIWWRGRARRAGRIFGINRIDIEQRNLACVLLLAGVVGLFSVGVSRASHTMDATAFMILGGLGILGFIAIGLIVDARARRHR